MLNSKELAQQQLEQIASQPRKAKQAKPVQQSLAAGIRYNASLQKMLRLVRRDINTMVLPSIKSLETEYTSDGWVDNINVIFNRLFSKWTSPLFKAASEDIAKQFVGGTGRASRAKFESAVKAIGIPVHADSQGLSDYLEASVSSNVDLIESIPVKYLNQVKTITVNNMRAGMRPSGIAKQIQEQFGVEKKRAKFIARDQTAKINGDISERRQTSAGFEYFKWHDVDDSRVRNSHESIANRVTKYGVGVYRWDDLPRNERGEQVKPGSDFSCRCVGSPQSNRQVKEFQEKNRGKS